MVAFELLVEFREVEKGEGVDECFPLERLILNLAQLVKLDQLIRRNDQRILWF